MKHRLNNFPLVALVGALLFAVVVGFVAGYLARAVPPTETRYVYVAPNERVVIDSKLYPAASEVYHNSDQQHPCDVRIYGGNIGMLPSELRDRLPEICEMHNASIWFAEDGTLYINLRLKTGYINGDEAMRERAPQLFELLMDEQLLSSYSFEGWYAPDSISFDASISLEDAYAKAYGGDTPENPVWNVDSIWFKAKG